MDKPNEKEELTMQNVPKAVNYLINEVAEMRVWALVWTNTGLSALTMPAVF